MVTPLPPIIRSIIVAAMCLAAVDLAVASPETEQAQIAEGGTQTSGASSEPASAQDTASQTPEVSGSSLTLRSSDDGLMLEVNGAPRHRVMNRLFASSDVTVRWTDDGYAQELIDGRYRGSREEISTRVLSGTNYIVSYEVIDGERRMASILIFGSDKRGQTSKSQRSYEKFAARKRRKQLRQDRAEQKTKVEVAVSVDAKTAAIQRKRNLQARAKLLKNTRLSVSAARHQQLVRTRLVALQKEDPEAAAALRRKQLQALAAKYSR